MKKYSANGKGTGKLGGSVFVINHGVQIEREYNGEVSNPSTPAQVGQRARFKLASQVSAALENVIVIPRKGIQSPRNRFVQKNMPFFYGDAEGAQVTYENLQLTLGAVGIPGIKVERIEANKMTLCLTSPVLKNVAYVAYSIFRKTDEEMLQYVDSVIQEVNVDVPDAFVEVDDPGGALVIYAYGYRLKNAKAKAKYDNYRVANARDMATLIANRRLEMSDVYFSGTRGTSLSSTDNGNVVAADNEALLYLSTNFNGTINLYLENQLVVQDASGVYNVQIGKQVKLVGIGNEIGGGRAGFDGWFNNGEQTPFSTDAELQFTMDSMRDIIGRWHPWSGLE